MEKMKKLAALLLALVMALTVAACDKAPGGEQTVPSTGTAPTETLPEETTPPETTPVRMSPEDGIFGLDYDSLYNVLGDRITIDMVYEVDGLAYAQVDGVEYELGMDFLSMAMICNTRPIPDNPAYDTADEVYNAWWRYYIQRWNALAAQVPLYSRRYCHVYSAKLKNYAVTPYWGAAQAIPLASVDKAQGDNALIVGTTGTLSGSFRDASFGKAQPGAADLEIQQLTTGLATVEADGTGLYAWNPTVVADHVETVNEDGSKTFQITIRKDLVFSDGSPITAANYLVHTLVFGSAVATQAAGRDAMAGACYVGYKAYRAADSEAVPFQGLRLIDTYTFSVTVAPEYLPDYYDLTYAAFRPEYLPMWLGNACAIADDGLGAFITGGWYDTDSEGYVHADHISKARRDIDTYPYSGPYRVTGWDEATGTATLTVNLRYPGGPSGFLPTIETVTYVKTTEQTCFEDLESGRVELLADLAGGEALDAALALVQENPERFESVCYDLDGYGRLGYRADFGPVSFPEVRQAIAYCMDRESFGQAVTGGYSSTVDGPYYTASASWIANQDTLTLNPYAVSTEDAIAVLEAGGWLYNADGTGYTGQGVRYRKLSPEELTEANRNYSSLDGAYKTVEVNGEYYMPLAVNWFAASGSAATELLKTTWAEADRTARIGMAVQYTQGDFRVLLAEYTQDPSAGYGGVPVYSVFNFTTGRQGAMYNFAWNWTIDPELFGTYSGCYIKDAADFYWYPQSLG